VFLFCSGLFRRQFETVGAKQTAKEEQKTIYDMITHLTGHPLPGIPQNSVPPKKKDEAMKQYLWQHRLLLLFLKYCFQLFFSYKIFYLIEHKVHVQLLFVRNIFFHQICIGFMYRCGKLLYQ